jgi:hypothetical protein
MCGSNIDSTIPTLLDSHPISTINMTRNLSTILPRVYSRGDEFQRKRQGTIYNMKRRAMAAAARERMIELTMPASLRRASAFVVSSLAVLRRGRPAPISALYCVSIRILNRKIAGGVPQLASRPVPSSGPPGSKRGDSRSLVRRRELRKPICVDRARGRPPTQRSRRVEINSSLPRRGLATARVGAASRARVAKGREPDFREKRVRSKNYRTLGNSTESPRPWRDDFPFNRGTNKRRQYNRRDCHCVASRGCRRSARPRFLR